MNTLILKYGMCLKDKDGETWVVWMYNADDVDPMAYKVALIDSAVRKQTYYSCDLVSLIEQGEFSVIE